MAINNAMTVNEVGLDDITSNSRVRASAALPYGVNWILGSGTPTTGTPGAAVTITAAQALTGIITFSPSTGCTATLDTAANLVAAVNASSAGTVVGDIIDILIINGSASNAITIAAGTGGSFDTNNSNRNIPVSSSKEFLIRFSNVNPGAEAYVIYF